MVRHREFVKGFAKLATIVIASLLRQNIQYSQVKGGKVWFSSQFVDVSLHSLLDPRQRGIAEVKQFMARQPGGSKK